MTSGKLWHVALVTAALIGCSDSAEKEEPIVVVDLNNGSNQSNNSVSNNTSTNSSNNANNVNNTQPVGVAIDLRADTNRDGVVSLTDDADDVGEDTWEATQGAVFLANIDDDDRSCPRAGNDEFLARCYDGNDDVLDGDSDLEDMAPLILRATGDLPAEATGTVRLATGAEHAQFFVNIGGTWTATTEFTANAAELAAGVEFRLEGRDVVRDESWDGLVRLEARLSGVPDAVATSDVVAMRVAPLVLRHHLDPVRQIYSSEFGIGGDGAFTASLKAAVTAAGVPEGHVELNVQDQWTQDYFETAYMAMPTAAGLKVIDVFIRSANIEQDFFGNVGLREAGRVVYTKFHGEDVAGLTAVGGNHSYQWDTLNSFGNTETIPPFSHNGESWPLGRIIRGQAGTIRGNEGMLSLLSAQEVQAPLYADTGWLLVAHIDETISFLKAENARGWVMLANDAAMAIDLFEQLEAQGRGRLEVFAGQQWLSNNNRPYSAATTVSDILQDTDVLSASADAVIEVDDQVSVIKAATGLTDDEIVPVPFTHWHYDGSSIAHQPGLVNGIVVNDRQFMAPDPHGPEDGGVDVFQAALETELAAVGYEVLWVEDWDMYHRLAGEIHCATNVVRDVDPNGPQWWEMTR